MHIAYIDSSCLGRRAQHAMGKQRLRNAVLFGFLKQLTSIQEELRADRFVFCFEGKNNLRKQLFPEYKQKRHSKERTPEEQEQEQEYHLQMWTLRKEVLPSLGFRNIVRLSGYESDDTIAAYCRMNKEDEHTIVTSDNDMLQCLRSNVSIWDPRRNQFYTKAHFIREYGMHPKSWWLVKALGGCKSDEVPGIPGIGESTAVKYVKGELKAESAKGRALASKEGQRVFARNTPLVKLPFEGAYELVPVHWADHVTAESWQATIDRFKLPSLKHGHTHFKRI